jgi:hypothetical protein
VPLILVGAVDGVLTVTTEVLAAVQPFADVDVAVYVWVAVGFAQTEVAAVFVVYDVVAPELVYRSVMLVFQVILFCLE